jgi:hypothetical protein
LEGEGYLAVLKRPDETTPLAKALKPIRDKKPQQKLHQSRSGRKTRKDPPAVDAFVWLSDAPAPESAHPRHPPFTRGLAHRRGLGPYAIQQHIGHESIKTTFDVYGHRFSHGDTDRLNTLAQMLSGRVSKATRVEPTAAGARRPAA